jgi:hypothetical protein
MKTRTISVHWLCLVLTAICFSAIGTAGPLRPGGDAPRRAHTHASGITARITLSDGGVRTIELQGLGCSEAICSRVFIRAREANHSESQIWLDSIAAIKSINHDSALFVMKDGTERRLALIPDFRVLYVTNSNGNSERIDLGAITALEMGH